MCVVRIRQCLYKLKEKILQEQRFFSVLFRSFCVGWLFVFFVFPSLLLHQCPQSAHLKAHDQRQRRFLFFTHAYSLFVRSLGHNRQAVVTPIPPFPNAPEPNPPTFSSSRPMNLKRLVLLIVRRRRRRAHKQGTIWSIYPHRSEVLLRTFRVNGGVGQEHENGGVLRAVLLDAQPRAERRLDAHLDRLAACNCGGEKRVSIRLVGLCPLRATTPCTYTWHPQSSKHASQHNLRRALTSMGPGK